MSETSELPDELSIHELPLSGRAHKALEADRIFTVGAIRALTDGELLRIPNFGHVCLREVREACRGLTPPHLDIPIIVAQLRQVIAEIESAIQRLQTIDRARGRTP
jgi:hypothetical protein